MEILKSCPFEEPVGDYEIENDKTMTEQEYLQTCTTEQLAEKLTDFSFWLVFELPTDKKRERIRKKIELWLKQPHTDKE